MCLFRTVNVTVPKKTRNNGTLYAYIFLHHSGVLPWHDGKQVHIVSPLTTYMIPKPEEVNLITGETGTQVGYLGKNCCLLILTEQVLLKSLAVVMHYSFSKG